MVTDIGVFLPIANNGWLISKTAPQYLPTFELHKAIVQKAEGYGLDFALSMVRFKGFGGETHHWDYALESFTLTAALAAVTNRIKLFASVAILTFPPAVVARMAVTIDSVSNGRFGVNIVAGWNKPEYLSLGLWPGDDHFAGRYEHAREYVSVLRELWETGRTSYRGKYFNLENAELLPSPKGSITLVGAGQSTAGMAFVAEQCDVSFIQGLGINTPLALGGAVSRLREAKARTGRQVGAYALFIVVADETDERAAARWKHYESGVDLSIAAAISGAAKSNKTMAADSSSRFIANPTSLPNSDIGTLIGSS